MREELAGLAGKIGELQAEAEEYRCEGSCRAVKLCWERAKLVNPMFK